MQFVSVIRSIMEDSESQPPPDVSNHFHDIGENPSYTCKEDFKKDMEQSIRDIIGESIVLLNRDPREYHPFYLTVFKYITLGQKLNYINQRVETVDFIWRHFDMLAGVEFVKSRSENVPFSGTRSLYATVILGEAANHNEEFIPTASTVKPLGNGEERKRCFRELESIAKDIIAERDELQEAACVSRLSCDDIRNDLSTRLKFFNHCQLITNPEDCLRINGIWSAFLDRFEGTDLDVTQAEQACLKMESEPLFDDEPECESEPLPDAPSPYSPIPPPSPHSSPGRCSIQAEESEELFKEHATNSVVPAKAKDQSNSEPQNEKAKGESQLQLDALGGTPLTCHECGEQLANKFSLAHHLANVHNGVVSSCPSCEKTFKTGQYLWVHFANVHLDHITKGIQPEDKVESYEHVCEFCAKDFATSYGLVKHIKEHHGELRERSFLCTTCGKSFSTMGSLQDHVRQFHLGFGEIYKCDICSRKCKTAGKLWKHKTNVHKITDLPVPSTVKVFQCEYCGEKVLRCLEFHVRKVHPDRLVEFKKTLARQMKSDKRRSITDRSKELRRLLKEKGFQAVDEGLVPMSMVPRKCDICSKTLSANQFGRHMRNVHGAGASSSSSIVLTCPETGCGKTFREKARLKSHIAKFHDNLDEKIEKRKLIKLLQNEDILRTFECALCSERRPRYEEVKIHLIINHPDVYTSLRNEPLVNNEVSNDADPSGNDDDATNDVDNSVSDAEPCPVVSNASDAQPPSDQETTCPYCSEKSSNLDEHVQSIHPDDCWICPIPRCSKLMFSPEELEQHFSSCHRKRKPETINADETTTDSKEKSKKRKTDSSELKFKCKRCPFNCPDQMKLNLHIKETHPNECFPCPIPTCQILRHTLRGIQFHVYKNHKRSHTPEETALLTGVESYTQFKLPCPVCGAEKSMRRLKDHLKLDHGIVEDNSLFNCPLCEKEFGRRDAFLTHVEEDHGHEVDMQEYVKRVSGISCKTLDSSENKNTAKTGESKIVRTKKSKRTNRNKSTKSAKPAVKRGRGRPRKRVKVEIESSSEDSDLE